MTTRAQIEERTAFLFTEFGEAKAREWFGDAAVESLPRFCRGKHAGKSKGVIVWRKVISGGWVAGDTTGQGYVERRVGRVFGRELREMAEFASGERYGKLIMKCE